MKQVIVNNAKQEDFYKTMLPQYPTTLLRLIVSLARLVDINNILVQRHVNCAVLVLRTMKPKQPPLRIVNLVLLRHTKTNKAKNIVKNARRVTTIHKLPVPRVAIVKLVKKKEVRLHIPHRYQTVFNDKFVMNVLPQRTTMRMLKAVAKIAPVGGFKQTRKRFHVLLARLANMKLETICCALIVPNLITKTWPQTLCAKSAPVVLHKLIQGQTCVTLVLLENLKVGIY
jgi:hypothetical protein